MVKTKDRNLPADALQWHFGKNHRALQCLKAFKSFDRLCRIITHACRKILKTLFTLLCGRVTLRIRADAGRRRKAGRRRHSKSADARKRRRLKRKSKQFYDGFRRPAGNSCTSAVRQLLSLTDKPRISPLLRSSQNPDDHSHYRAVLRTSLHAYVRCPVRCPCICACKHAHLHGRRTGAYPFIIRTKSAGSLRPRPSRSRLRRSGPWRA